MPQKWRLQKRSNMNVTDEKLFDYTEQRLQSLVAPLYTIHSETGNKIGKMEKHLEDLKKSQMQHFIDDAKNFGDIQKSLLVMKDVVPFLEEQKRDRENWDRRTKDIEMVGKVLKWIVYVAGSTVSFIVAWRVLKVYIVAFLKYTFL